MNKIILSLLLVIIFSSCKESINPNFIVNDIKIKMQTNESLNNTALVKYYIDSLNYIVKRKYASLNGEWDKKSVKKIPFYKKKIKSLSKLTKKEINDKIKDEVYNDMDYNSALELMKEFKEINVHLELISDLMKIKSDSSRMVIKEKVNTTLKIGLTSSLEILNNTDEIIENSYVLEVIKFQFNNKELSYFKKTHILNNNDLWKQKEIKSITFDDIITYAVGYNKKIFLTHKPKKVTIEFYIFADNSIGFSTNKNGHSSHHKHNSTFGDFSDLKNNFSSFEQLYSKDITNIWFSKPIENNESENCKTVSFSNKKISLPQIDNWTECIDDKLVNEYVKSIELNTKIIGFYLPINKFNIFKKDNYINGMFPVISLFSLKRDLDNDVDNSILSNANLGFTNMCTNNWDKVKKGINNFDENLIIEKPILIKTINSKENIKTNIMVNQFISDKGKSYRISFINVCVINKRLLIFTFAQEYNKDTSIDELIKQNEYQITELNKCNNEI